jgi:hypothetical protein
VLRLLTHCEYTCNSDSCPAGQPVFAVNVSFTYRTFAAVNVTPAVLPVLGLNV